MGCGLHDLDRDLASAADTAWLGGDVQVPGWDGEAAIHVALYAPPGDDGAPLRVRFSRVLAEPGPFAFSAPPGTYRVAAIVDTDGSGALDAGEPVAVSEPFTLAPRERRTDLALVVEAPASDATARANEGAVDERLLVTGEVASLDDPRLGRDAAEAGLWRPVASLRTHPPGLFFLGERDPARTPVLLVHGMAGHASEFAALAPALAEAGLEPWVFQYPSALPLRAVASMLDRAVLAVRARHGTDRLCVVAHSMGGLVSRHWLGGQRHTDVPVFATLASPLGGMASAAAGVEAAPVVVPSWRDLVPDGEFITALYDRALPDGTAYHLAFAYLAEGATDGTVAIQSQLRQAAQREAMRVRGFETSHVGVLDDADVRAWLLDALAPCAESPSAPPTADVAPAPAAVPSP